MAVKIRLARHGAKKKPYYRIVVADSESPRDGRYLEAVGIKILLNGMERSLHETYNFAGRLQLSPGGMGNTAVPLSYDGWHNTIGGGWGAWIRDPNIEIAIEPNSTKTRLREWASRMAGISISRRLALEISM